MKTIKRIHCIIIGFSILYFIGFVFLWITTDFQKDVILFCDPPNSVERQVFNICGGLFGLSFISTVISLVVSFLFLLINIKKT